MTPHERAIAVVVFAVLVGIVGGWLFSWVSLVVLPIVYVWCLRRYTRKERDQ